VVVILRQRELPRELADAVSSLARRARAEQPMALSGRVLRTYGVGAQILRDLGVHRMRVLSAPKQMHGISAFGLEIVEYVGESA